MLKESIGHTLLSISLLGIKGWDGQAGLEAEVHRTYFTVHQSLRVKSDGMEKHH